MRKYFYAVMAVTAAICPSFGQNSHSGAIPAYSSRNILNGGITDSSQFIITNKGKVVLNFCMDSSSSAPCKGGVVVPPGQTVTKKVSDLGGLTNGSNLNVTNTTDANGNYMVTGPSSGPVHGPGSGPGPAPGPIDCNSVGNPGGTPVIKSDWKSITHENYGIIYTGYPCPAYVGIGTDNPAGMFDVRGNGLFSGKVGIGTITPQQKLQIDNGNILIRGNNNFNANGHEATLFLGDQYNSIKSVFGTGIKINAFGTTDAIVIKQSSGNVGIGTNTPDARLEINGIVQITKNSHGYLRLGAINTTTDNFGYVSSSGQENGTGLKFETPEAGSINGITRMTITNTGCVGIGTTLINNPNNYKLAVNGSIGAKGIKVEINSNTWSDYVFEKNYKLRDLFEVEKYINENKHLPGIESATKIGEKGLDVGEMLSLQMAKIEELTLYMIELKKENEALKNKLLEVLTSSSLGKK